MIDYSSLEYPDLAAMVANADHEKIVAAGDRLAAAANAIQHAAISLQLQRADWSGAAADEFGRWRGDVVTSAKELADYTQTASTALHEAGYQLARVKPLVQSLPANATPEQQAAAHGDAAFLIGTLASSYSTQLDTMNRAKVPTPARPANVHYTEFGGDSEDDVGGAAGVGAAAAAGIAGMSGMAGPGALSVSTAKQPWPPTAAGGSPSVLTSVQPVGYSPQASNLLGGAPPSSSVPLVAAAQLPGASGPTSAGTPAASAPFSGAGPFTGGRSAPTGGGPGAFGRTGNVPGRTVPPGIAAPGGAGGLRSGEVLGGASRPGQVFSEQAPHSGAGRPGVPMAPGTGTGPVGSGGRGARSGDARPVGLRGGVVGAPHAPVDPVSGASGRPAFSPGGSGLRSGGAEPGHSAGHGSSRGEGAARGGPVGAAPAAGDSSARRRRQRPDYLDEDDETWVGRGPGAVPPVIG